MCWFPRRFQIRQGVRRWRKPSAVTIITVLEEEEKPEKSFYDSYKEGLISPADHNLIITRKIKIEKMWEFHARGLCTKIETQVVGVAPLTGKWIYLPDTDLSRIYPLTDKHKQYGWPQRKKIDESME